VTIGVDQIVAAQHRDIEQAQRLLSRRAVKTTEDALARVDRQLRRAPAGSWSEAQARATKAQLRTALMTLALAHQQDLAAGLPPVMRKSQERTADYLRTLDKQYLGAVRPLRFDTLQWWERHSAELGQVRLRQFGRSFQRYGAASVLAVEQAISAAVVVGERWDVARREVWKATARVVGERQWMVDRILRTEVSAAYNGTNLAALLKEDDPEAPMLKKLVATFDKVTGWDSIGVHGQTKPVREPFCDGKGRLYMAPPNRPHDREIVVGWRSSWGESLPNFDQKTAQADPRFLEAPADMLPPAPPLKIEKPRAPPKSGSPGSRFPPEKVLLQTRIGPQQASPQRALLAALTARRLVVASQLRAAITASKLRPSLVTAERPAERPAVDPLAGQVDRLKTEYRDLRIRQALAATGVRAAEGDVVAQRDIKPGNYLDFGGIVFQVVRSDATGIRVRTPYGVAMLPAGPVPATVRTKKPDKVLRPRSLLDVRALVGIVAARRAAA